MQHSPNPERSGIKEDQRGASLGSATRKDFLGGLEEDGVEIMNDQVAGELGCGFRGVPKELTGKLGQFWVK